MDKKDMEKLRENLGDYLRQKGLPTRRAFRCLSPAHEDKHPSMHYNSALHNVHCFSCGCTYDLFDLVGMDYGLDRFPERLEKVCDIFGCSPSGGKVFRLDKRASQEYISVALHKACCSDVSDNPDKIEKDVHIQRNPERNLSEGVDGALEKLRSCSCGSTAYLEYRGVSWETIKKYGLFEQGGRAYFPVWEAGRSTGWCARAVDDSVKPRYKNSGGRLGVWNGDLLLCPGNGERLYITEGVIDAITLEQMGCRAVSLCGSQNTGKLTARCRESVHAQSWRYVLCGDNDDAGRRMNDTLREELTALGLTVEVLAPSGGDWNSLYLEDRPMLDALLEGGGDAEPDGGRYSGTSAAGALDAFFSCVESRAGRGAVSTGFPRLDKLLDGGLYSGLYVLGAISSLGKTSLALQIADYIAANGRDVLFVSLEQERFELIAKSLSRVSAELSQGGVTPFSTRELLSGRFSENDRRRELLKACRAAYRQAAAGLFIREGLANVGPEEIRGMVQEHLQQRGQAPVLVVDYLQILTPLEPRLSDKQAVDRAVVELKRISRAFDIPVLAISSFNRENYRCAVSMEAFKESGAVEYSADVLMGLQLLGVGGRDFDVNAAKCREPRQLELVILKNRSGIPYAKLPMVYDARYNLFAQGRGNVAVHTAPCAI